MACTGGAVVRRSVCVYICMCVCGSECVSLCVRVCVRVCDIKDDSLCVALQASASGLCQLHFTRLRQLALIGETQVLQVAHI